MISLMETDEAEGPVSIIGLKRIIAETLPSTSSLRQWIESEKDMLPQEEWKVLRKR